MLRNWLSELRKYVVCSCAGVLVAAGASQAQEVSLPQYPMPEAPAPLAQPPLDDLKAQVEAQAREIEELKNMIRAGQIKPAAAEAADPAKPVDEDQVKKILDAYMKEKDSKKKKDDEAAAKKANDEGYKVGTDLKMGVRWNPTNGVTFETPNKEFTSHLGVRFQLDDVFFHQNPNTRPAAQLGDLQDGVFFRRMRPSWDGTAWEVVEWNVELALEQTQQSIPTLDEVWVGVTKIPLIGTVRAGHLKVPHGFEGDSVSSSKAMTFMERSSMGDAFFFDNFATGVWAGNSILDQRATWSAMGYREDNYTNGNNGADFGDGYYGVSGRATWLPFYECEGRHLLHLGVSGTWRGAERPDATVPPSAQGGIAGPRVVRFRARPEMRDAIGDFGNNALGLPGNSSRLIDTGTFFSDSTALLGTEFFGVWGAFSLQGEYVWSYNPDARLVNRGPNIGTVGLGGGYIQASYFLTGENRTYDRRLGREASTYIATPYTPFWAVRGEDGRLSWGPGAWEVAARFSRTNLNDGLIHGGIEEGLTLGLNWYLNNNLKVQFEYLHDNRSNLKTGVVPGDVDAFGIRTQFFF